MSSVYLLLMIGGLPGLLAVFVYAGLEAAEPVHGFRPQHSVPYAVIIACMALSSLQIARMDRMDPTREKMPLWNVPCIVIAIFLLPVSAAALSIVVGTFVARGGCLLHAEGLHPGFAIPGVLIAAPAIYALHAIIPFGIEAAYNRLYPLPPEPQKQPAPGTSAQNETPSASP